MPEWIWILALFAALTIAYFAGFAAGCHGRTDTEDRETEEETEDEAQQWTRSRQGR